MKDCFKLGNHVGIFLTLLFVLCFFWYWIHPVQQQLHLQVLESVFFGYDGMNIGSFILGLIQSYIWGYILSALWCLSGCSAGRYKRKL